VGVTEEGDVHPLADCGTNAGAQVGRLLRPGRAGVAGRLAKLIITVGCGQVMESNLGVRLREVDEA
jgi:hypothetical protein